MRAAVRERRRVTPAERFERQMERERRERARYYQRVVKAITSAVYSVVDRRPAEKGIK